jgi:hypothetical protein
MESEFDEELRPYKSFLDHIKKDEGLCEQGYHFKWNEDKTELIRCEADDKEAWFRSYIDWICIKGDKASVKDWKNGRPKHTKQLQFYAWVVMLAHPHVEEVSAVFHFLKYKDQINEWFSRDQFESGKLFKPFQEVLDSIDECYRADIWPEIPGPISKYGDPAHCKYCPVTKEHCSYGKDV